MTVIIENMLTEVLNFSNFDYERLTWSIGPCFLDVSDPCSSGKITFYLYTRLSPETPVKLSVGDAAMPPEYNYTAETKILIHGYAGSVDFRGIVAVRRAYMKKGNFNVVVVDWGELVKLPCYPVAVVNTLQAGKCTASLLAHVASLTRADISEFHAIGFSLGAHVAAFASNELEKTKGKKLGRISGLDPALPLFASLEKSWKLDKNDALFVDIIHTNVGVFGKIEATGHADFYLNRGFSQPACKNSPDVPLCSHVMALAYYAESITVDDDDGFWGKPCSSYVQHVIGMCETETQTTESRLMGDNCDRKTRGTYLVSTRDSPPYALGRPLP